MAEQITPQDLNSRIGRSGTYNFGGHLDYDLEYNYDLMPDQWLGSWGSPGIVAKMLRSDAQVAATQLAVDLSILAGRWTVEGGSEEARELVRLNFFELQSWPLLLGNILLYLPYGFSAFEHYIFNATRNGKRRTWLRLETRLPWTVRRFYTEDERLSKVEQDTDTGTYPITADRLTLFTHRRVGLNYAGTSCLRPAYKNWKIKDYLQKLQSVAFDRTATPVIHAEAPFNVTAEDKQAIKEFAANLRSNEQNYVITTKKGLDKATGWEIHFLSMKDAVISVDAAIAAHDAQIARNMLLDMISAGDNERGSYAMVKTKKDFFLTGLQAHADYIGDMLSMGIPGELTAPVQKLVDINLGEQTEYPRITCSQLSAQSVESIAKAAETVVTMSGSAIDKAASEHFRKLFGVPTDETQEDAEE